MTTSCVLTSEANIRHRDGTIAQAIVVRVRALWIGADEDLGAIVQTIAISITAVTGQRVRVGHARIIGIRIGVIGRAITIRITCGACQRVRVRRAGLQTIWRTRTIRITRLRRRQDAVVVIIGVQIVRRAVIVGVVVCRVVVAVDVLGSGQDAILVIIDVEVVWRAVIVGVIVCGVAVTVDILVERRDTVVVIVRVERVDQHVQVGVTRVVDVLNLDIIAHAITVGVCLVRVGPDRVLLAVEQRVTIGVTIGVERLARIEVSGDAVVVSIQAPLDTIEDSVPVCIGVRPVWPARAIDVVVAERGGVCDLIRGQDAVVIIIGVERIDQAISVAVLTTCGVLAIDADVGHIDHAIAQAIAVAVREERIGPHRSLERGRYPIEIRIAIIAKQRGELVCKAHDPVAIPIREVVDATIIVPVRCGQGRARDIEGAVIVRVDLLEVRRRVIVQVRERRGETIHATIIVGIISIREAIAIQVVVARLVDVVDAIVITVEIALVRDAITISVSTVQRRRGLDRIRDAVAIIIGVAVIWDAIAIAVELAEIKLADPISVEQIRARVIDVAIRIGVARVDRVVDAVTVGVHASERQPGLVCIKDAVVIAVRVQEIRGPIAIGVDGRNRRACDETGAVVDRVVVGDRVDVDVTIREDAIVILCHRDPDIARWLTSNDKGLGRRVEVGVALRVGEVLAVNRLSDAQNRIAERSRVDSDGLTDSDLILEEDDDKLVGLVEPGVRSIRRAEDVIRVKRAALALDQGAVPGDRRRRRITRQVERIVETIPIEVLSARLAIGEAWLRLVGIRDAIAIRVEVAVVRDAIAIRIEDRRRRLALPITIRVRTVDRVRIEVIEDIVPIRVPIRIGGEPRRLIDIEDAIAVAVRIVAIEHAVAVRLGDAHAGVAKRGRERRERVSERDKRRATIVIRRQQVRTIWRARFHRVCSQNASQGWPERCAVALIPVIPGRDPVDKDV